MSCPSDKTKTRDPECATSRRISRNPRQRLCLVLAESCRNVINVILYFAEDSDSVVAGFPVRNKQTNKQQQTESASLEWVYNMFILTSVNKSSLVSNVLLILIQWIVLLQLFQTLDHEIVRIMEVVNYVKQACDSCHF